MQTWRGKNDSFEVSEATGTTTVVLPGIGLEYAADAYVVETKLETWRVSLLREAYGHVAMALVVRTSPDPVELIMESVWYLAPASAARLPEHLVGCDEGQLRAWLFDGLMDEHRIDPISPRQQLRVANADEIAPEIIRRLENAVREILRAPMVVDGPMLFAVGSGTSVGDNLNATEVTQLVLRAGIGVKSGELTGLVVLEVGWFDLDTSEREMLRGGSCALDSTANSWLFLPACRHEFERLLCGSLSGVPLKSVQLVAADGQ